MAFAGPSGNLPALDPPFNWDLVRVLDPRIEGRAMAMYLITKDVRVSDMEMRGNAPGEISFKTRRVVCSPMVTSGDPNTVYEILNFRVIDPRFVPSTVQVCFTIQEAIAFRQSMTSTNAARAIVESGEKIFRLKCYLPGCIATSSAMDKLKAHFLRDHPRMPFEAQKIKIYEFGSDDDPSVIRSSGARYNTLPPAEPQHKIKSTILTMDAKMQANKDANSIGGALKHRRGSGVTDLQIPAKVARTHFPSGSMTGAIRMAQASPATAPASKSVYGPLTAQKKAVDKHLMYNPSKQQVAAEGEEVFCMCFKPEDGRPKIECANGAVCLLRWYHIECIGMTEESLPGDDEDWYCGRCIDQGIGGAARLKPMPVLPRKVLQPRSIKTRMELRQVDEGKGKGKAPAVPRGMGRNTTVPKASPSVNLHPWSADMENALADNPDNLKDLDLGSLKQAQAALRNLGEVPLGRPQSPPGNGTGTRQDRWGRTVTIAGTLKTPNSRSWTKDEETHLKAVMGECVAAGLSGEPLWRAAHPKLVKRGVNRPIGGMKMRWLRGLREETNIDERRKKNDRKMATALQGPKSAKDAGTPKKAHFKGKAQLEAGEKATDSNPIRKSTGNLGSRTIPTGKLGKSSRVDGFTSNKDVDMREGSAESNASDHSVMRDLVQGSRDRASSV